jgi:hypothetical protein
MVAINENSRIPKEIRRNLNGDIIPPEYIEELAEVLRVLEAKCPQVSRARIQALSGALDWLDFKYL